MSHRSPLTAEIISVGDELIGGNHVDLNAPRLARGLLSIGFEPRRFSTVPDDRAALGEALGLSAGRAQIVLVSGGLGPTEDDITRHAAADALGVSLDFDQSSWDQILHFMQKRGKNVSESNRLSAMFPRGAKIIPNGAGTAPGFRIQIGKAWLYFLPGPPHEAEQMWETHILPELVREFQDRANHFEKRLHLFGISESTIGSQIADRMQRGRNPRVGTSVRKGVTTINILARAKDLNSARDSAIQEAREIASLFSPYVFGEDGLSLPESLLQLLREKKLTLATAESCTGGLVGKLITDVAGSSDVFRGGWIAYSNSLKEKFLGVPSAILEKYGAVSEQSAQAMAEGAAKLAQADLALAITGIAGPGGGSSEKPVGLVYEAVRYQGKTTVEKKIYPPGDRKRIRDLAARDLLHLARLRVL